MVDQAGRHLQSGSERVSWSDEVVFSTAWGGGWSSSSCSQVPGAWCTDGGGGQWTSSLCGQSQHSQVSIRMIEQYLSRSSEVMSFFYWLYKRPFMALIYWINNNNK